MTLSQLAKLANVSVSVASKAFSGRDDVSESMRDHVFAVAREHGCFQQFYNAPYERPVVAVIVPEIDSRCYLKYIEEFKRAVDRNGYTMLLSVSNFDPQMEQTLIKYYSDHGKVNALISVSSHTVFPGGNDTVFINVGRGLSKCGVSVNAELRDGLAEAVEVLVKSGHRRIAYVSEPYTAPKGDKLHACLQKHGLALRDEYFIHSPKRFEEAGIDGAARLMELPQPPTAIFGAYGNVTQGILTELRRRGVSVPGEVSVISMDHTPDPLDETLDVAYIDDRISEVCALVMREIECRLGEPDANAPLSLILPTHFHKGDTVRDLI